MLAYGVSNAYVELGDEAALCEKVGMKMEMERGVAPPLKVRR